MSEEDQKRAAEERALIINRYSQGGQGSHRSEDDPTQINIYLATDRYGFIHDKPLPQKADSHEKRMWQVETEREKKWVKMLKNWKDMLPTEKLRRRTYKGIPNSLRGRVWSHLLNVETTKQEQQGKYEEMLQRAWSLAPEIRQIDLDINRTFNSHEMFHERYGLKQQALFNVLSAYSVYNGEVGYCQGMSEIAAVFLMYLDEEDAFWAIHALMSDKKYSMHGLFIPEFPKFKRFCTHHEKIMAKFLPKLKKHFESCGIEPQIYTLKWILQCFMTSIPFSLSLRVWDVYLLEGERVEIGMAYTVHKMHKMHLSRLPFDSILPYLQRKLPGAFGLEDDAVMTTLERGLEELRRARLDHMGSPPENELPKYPYGTYIPPPHERKVTQRTTVLNRDAVITEGNSRISVEGGGLGGSKFSFDPSIDDASSILDCHLSGSRRSLADTSVTSTADLSVFSTTTRSQALDNSLDAHSNASDGSGGGPNIPGIGHPGSVQRGPSAHSTPRAMAHAPSPDVVRIYVPYASSSPTPAPSPQNGDVPRSLPRSLPDQNKIRIRVDTQDEQTPVIEHEQLIRPFRLDSPEIDLK